MVPWIVGGLVGASVLWFFKINGQKADTPMTPADDKKLPLPTATMTPARTEILNAALTNQIDPAKMKQLADAFAQQGLQAQASMIQAAAPAQQPQQDEPTSAPSQASASDGNTNAAPQASSAEQSQAPQAPVQPAPIPSSAPVVPPMVVPSAAPTAVRTAVASAKIASTANPSPAAPLQLGRINLSVPTANATAHTPIVSPPVSSAMRRQVAFTPAPARPITKR